MEKEWVLLRVLDKVFTTAWAVTWLSASPGEREERRRRTVLPFILSGAVSNSGQTDLTAGCGGRKPAAALESCKLSSSGNRQALL